MTDKEHMNDDYPRIEKAIRYIHSHVPGQPSLEEIAAHVGLSPFHFQRLFRRWAGVSPKRFLEYLTVAHAKRLLKENKTILQTSYELGLSSAGRLHDQFVSIEAVSPGEFKSRGKELTITYGIHDSPFGRMLLAMTARGICSLCFEHAASFEQDLAALKHTWRGAKIVEDETVTSRTASKLFTQTARTKTELHLCVQGTNFQINVWKALLRLPFGQIASYQQFAEQMGRPGAHRSVASAIAANPVGFLIPCHRVLRSTGDIGIYHWGSERKHAMIAWEVARLMNNDAEPEVESHGVDTFPIEETSN